MWRNRACYNMVSLHGTTVNHFDQVDEVLLQSKDSKPLGIVRRSKIDFHVLSVEEEDHAWK